jgi:hypothetical protein
MFTNAFTNSPVICIFFHKFEIETDKESRNEKIGGNFGTEQVAKRPPSLVGVAKQCDWK